MHSGRFPRSYRWMGLGFLLGLLVFASFALAQTTIHRNAFEAKLGWSKGGFDAPYEEIAHQIDDREPHNGRGSRIHRARRQAGQRTSTTSIPIGKAPINDELRAALWLRANRPGIKLMARVVLPKERDPKNLGYRHDHLHPGRRLSAGRAAGSSWRSAGRHAEPRSSSSS